MSELEYEAPSTTRPRVLAIDPPDCGCTECITGEYVPLGSATPEQIRDAHLGRIHDNTGGMLPEPTAEIALMKLRVLVQDDLDYLADAGARSDSIAASLGSIEKSLWTYKAEGVRMVLDYIDEALGELR